MVHFNFLDGSRWDYHFYAEDCGSSNVSISHQSMHLNHTKVVLYAIYVACVSAVGYIYGRHKGLSQRPSAFLSDQTTKHQLFAWSTKVWFVLSTFIWPWTFCVIWLFYAIRFDLHYVNDHNPWMLPLLIVYCIYSLVTFFSYLYFTDFSLDECAKKLIRTTIAFGTLFTFSLLYVLMTNVSNDPDRWSFGVFYGNQWVHCINFSQRINPCVLLIFCILYLLITHHIFVILRAIAAKCCHNGYVEKTDNFKYRMQEKKDRRILMQQMKNGDFDHRAGARSQCAQQEDVAHVMRLSDEQQLHPFNDFYLKQSPSMIASEYNNVPSLESQEHKIVHVLL